MDVDSATDTFYDLVNAAIADYVPTVELGARFPPWFDRDVKAALRRKEALFKTKKSTSSPENISAFSQARSEFKSLVNHRYRSYLMGLVSDFKSNPKRFWSFIKSLKSSSRTSPSLVYDGQTYTSDIDRADCLNRCFSKKFSDLNVASLPSAPEPNVPSLNKFNISRGKVESLLLSLDRHKACGPDGLSARILSECARELAVPIEILCRLSVEQGVFPKRWKEANIIPVHKKGDKKLPENYRPVSLLPLCSKVLEKVVYDSLLDHCRPALPFNQHGFLPKRSCITNLACFLNSAWESIAEGKQLDAVYTDYSSAFTSVNHKLLLHKMKHSFNVTDRAYMWIASYLSNRTQRVVLNGKQSEWAPVLSGVPEGSICGPLLFTCYTADIPLVIRGGCTMYADDIKLHRPIRCVEDVTHLQADIDSLVQWSHTWKLRLNPTKCHVISFTLRTSPISAVYTMDGIVLGRCAEVRDLGVILDSKLTFAKHVDATVAKSRRMLGLLIRSMQMSACPRRAKLNYRALLTAYCSHVRSIMEYGSVVWSGAAVTHLKRLERIQHTFLIWLACSSDRNSSSLSYDQLLKQFNVSSIKSRFLQHDLMFIHNIFHGRIDCPELLSSFHLSAPVRRNRSPVLWHVPFARVSTVKGGPICRVSHECNALLHSFSDLDFFGSSSATYRVSVRSHVAQSGAY